MYLEINKSNHVFANPDALRGEAISLTDWETASQKDARGDVDMPSFIYFIHKKGNAEHCYQDL